MIRGDDVPHSLHRGRDDARRLKLDTLVRLRWLAVAGQAGAVAFVHFALVYRMPFVACLAVIGCAAALNVFLGLRWPASHRLGETTGAAILAFDILQLAALLFLTGGLQNPFSILFLAPVMISATTLSPRVTLSLGALAVACATGLAYLHMKLPWGPSGPFVIPPLYLAGIWTALVLGLAFTGLFAHRVAEEARQLQAALAATEFVLAREQHLSQLDGLAAAAAHELGTPLATIALVARDLDGQAPPGSVMAADTLLLREQVERCRVILSKLTSLGDEEGFFERMSLGHLVEEVVEPQRAFDVALDVDAEGDGPEPVCRRSPGVTYGLANLVDNAVDFARERITIASRWSADEVSIEIRDDGPGFDPDVLLRVGEPYVTSRGRGRAEDLGDDAVTGLGLGLFIAKTLIERSGGALSFANASPPGGGAIVRVVWRRRDFEAGAAAHGTPLPATLPQAESVTI